ncbi:M15 family metallopeptidase [Motilibacter aurantiacus]|uniref:M15 family metallopeptidase n=1 Tax=Motilibacter aurantiacus TaxID=2714955 RepID=UPI00140B58CC|nr:M15 family metallopeptidase [Motilibacter aurantiacus]NHC47439.1 M15 family metallopeptidase [Motilibacter aurantiacus]
MASPRVLRLPAALLVLAAATFVAPHAGHGAEEGLDPELGRRVTLALAAAQAADVPLHVTSGRRSWAHQQRLLDEAIEKHGSRAAATRWVLPPQDSAHVHGLAVDVGPREGMAWLEEHGAAYGLCRRYANEPWHFEPLVAPGGRCPALEPHPVAATQAG